MENTGIPQILILILIIEMKVIFNFFEFHFKEFKMVHKIKRLSLHNCCVASVLYNGLKGRACLSLFQYDVGQTLEG